MKFVAYYRVSTARQGASGLGLEAQEAAVQQLVRLRNGEIVKTFREIESGANNDRVELAAAMAYTKASNATLVVAKLDRLARDAKFLLQLADAGVPILFGDFPDLDATTPVGRMVLTQMAAVAEFERRRISERVVAALQAAKARGVKLGGRRERGGFTDETRAYGPRAYEAQADAKALAVFEKIKELDPAGVLSRTKLAAVLTENSVPTPTKKGCWNTTAVTRIFKRVEAIHERQRSDAAESVRSVSERLQARPRAVCAGGAGGPA